MGACLLVSFIPTFFSSSYKNFTPSVSDSATQLKPKNVIPMQNVAGEKTSDGIKMVRFTRDNFWGFIAGKACEFQ